MPLKWPRLGERSRKFLREVGSVVLGVLIALGLGAVASDIGWRMEVADAREQLRYELGHNRELARWGFEEVPCVTRRLDELAAILAQASRTRQLPPVGAIGTPGMGTWPRGVWDSTIAAQTAAHFPAKERASLSRVYRLLEGNMRNDEDVRRSWQALDMMTGPGRPLDTVTEGNLYAALAIARRSNAAALGRIKALDLYLSTLLGADFAQLDPANPPLRGKTTICDPLAHAGVPGYGSYAPDSQSAPR